MQLQQYGLEYFNNGREFILKGLFPNLTDIFVEIRCTTIQDPYHALFPYSMSRTVQNLNIHYICGLGPFDLGPPDDIRRYTPIRYPSTPHKLKRLIVSGVKGRVDLARLWESLFEVEEFIVDGQVLPVGEDAPWGLDLNQALDILKLGCKGVGWNWYQLRPWHPSDEHYCADWGEVVITGETVEQFGIDSADRLIRRPKSFSNLHDSLIGEKTTMRPLRRTKSCMSALPLTDYPYGSCVWRPELLESYSEYQIDNLLSY
ncbi:hypothetical protein Clacol_005715 [Clathrus columnatus]|uniref:Uncharacterized protein n=1 Tax=Clathrus columnatus TaxID=1419009 RepID=A0AAV5ACR6_9AGAM|nr:hypothetical protein Clacol_005715 [Clathrus columnatus]